MTTFIKKSLGSQNTVYKDQKASLNSKYGVKKKINTAYDKYLNPRCPWLGRGGGWSCKEYQSFSRKKLYSFLKIQSHSDDQGIALKKKKKKKKKKTVSMSVQMMLTKQTSVLHSFNQFFNKNTPRSNEALSYYYVEWRNLTCLPFRMNVYVKSKSCKTLKLPQQESASSSLALPYF